VRRVVSLVPSATETLRALGLDPIACTRFCEQPDLPALGGTKNPDVDAIVALAPDVVVMNDEENRAEDAEALVAAGLRVHSMSPRSVADVGPAVVTLGETVGVGVPARFGAGEWESWLAEQAATPGRARAAVLVWRRPWMTMNGDTYGSSLLDAIGIDNVFAGDEDRYPEVTLETISARRPDTVLLPSEPYVFKDRHVDEVAAALPGVEARLADGRDLFWWGIRTPDALSRLRDALFRASGGPV
jgi:ABC-type Fe3+-hydroxamate transport system substrate-binding protein